ncbi:MAG: hypothetical protein IAE85_19250 [Anaerolinea sp.]|nr:hypothetical protein [Anaerolinea sp.]
MSIVANTCLPEVPASRLIGNQWERLQQALAIGEGTPSPVLEFTGRTSCVPGRPSWSADLAAASDTSGGDSAEQQFRILKMEAQRRSVVEQQACGNGRGPHGFKLARGDVHA